MKYDAEYYRNLIGRAAGATIGFAFATNAVYAAKFGICEAENLENEEWLSIARKLKETYGNYLTADQVLAEMKSCRKPAEKTPRRRRGDT